MAVMAVMTMTAGCAGLPKGPPTCVEMQNNLAITEFDTIKKIVLEEAQNNGVTDMNGQFDPPRFVKPSKFNNWKGEIVYTAFQGPPKLEVKFDKNVICFREYNTITRAAGAKNAIAAIQDRLQDVKGNKLKFENNPDRK